MTVGAQVAAAEVAELRLADHWDYCADCRTPYRMEDLVEYAERLGEPLYICRWHAARRREKRSA